ncbi:hypothetical protein ACFQL7_20525 [Halocatena marina]|uniref:Uncharacterized protein n=1 Tax=Halocatena marina TaxID=2934937 RepID=A0ABD5YRK5_9EURY|nr:hypothetical protein [Halocatena marina]
MSSAAQTSSDSDVDQPDKIEQLETVLDEYDHIWIADPENDSGKTIVGVEPRNRANVCLYRSQSRAFERIGFKISFISDREPGMYIYLEYVGEQ